MAAPVASVPTVAPRSKAVRAPRPSGRVDVASRRARMAPTRSGASRSEAISTVAGVAAEAALTRSATVGRVLALRVAASAAETARTSGLVAMAGASVAVATLSSLARVSHSVELGIQTSGGWMEPRLELDEDGGRRLGRDGDVDAYLRLGAHPLRDRRDDGRDVGRRRHPQGGPSGGAVGRRRGVAAGEEQPTGHDQGNDRDGGGDDGRGPAGAGLTRHDAHPPRGRAARGGRPSSPWWPGRGPASRASPPAWSPAGRRSPRRAGARRTA